MTPQDWLAQTILSQIAGTQVFSDATWDPNLSSSAYYSTGDPNYASPHILLRAQDAKRIQKVLSGQRKLDIGNVSSSLRNFANEMAHAKGMDRTDVGGFDGGTRHRPVIMSLVNQLLKKSKLPKQQKKAIRREVSMQQQGTIQAAPLPQPMPAQAQDSIPIIGRAGVIGYQ